MEKIIIKQNENKTFTVEQGDKISCDCGWDEMMGLLASLTIPKEKPCLQWMKKKEKSYKPKEGEEFWCSSYEVVDDSMCFCPRKGKYITDENDDDFDLYAFVAPDYKKCFKIDEEKECQEYCDKLNEAIRNVK